MHRTAAFWGVLSVLIVALPVVAQDPVKVAPQQCKVEFENDHVRVLRWKIGPGEKTPLHEHPALVKVVLTDGRVKFTLADGKTRESDGKAGLVIWNEPEKHASENLGDKPTEAIEIELKAQARGRR